MIRKLEALTLNEIQLFGKALGQKVQPGDIILLFGELGAGKTTITQSIALGSGISKKECVTSPTFTLINQYASHYPIYHIDLYRLESRLAIENLGLEEYFFNNGVTIVEWAEKLLLPENSTYMFGIDSRLEIHIEIKTNNTRNINIKSFGLHSRIP